MDPMLRVDDVAARLDCSRHQVSALIKSGRLAAVRLSPREVRVPQSALERFIAASTDEGSGGATR